MRLALLFPLFCIALWTACGTGEVPGQTSTSSSFIEGKDYLVLERRRFLDQTRFDQPVEAFSLLFPKGWQIEGGVRWLGIQDCRADLVSNHVKANSPDGAIQYEAKPSKSFSWADEPMMFQALQAGARAGGCQMSRPFDATQYATNYARQELKAEISEIRTDEAQAPALRQLDAQANQISQQYNNGMQQNSSMVFGKLTWPNGDEGILHTGVINMLTRKRDMFSGQTATFSNTSVFYNVMMRFPAARKEEATKLFGMLQTSFRESPVWRQAKDRFLTQLGNIEHAGRMETLRLMGEQSRAYAKAQSEASDQRMRDWESQQASQDTQHKAFVQTIREVETWSDGSGKVELSSGYDQAWSRGDGTYILSNSPSFDPSAVFQDQAWQEMKRAKP